MRIIESCNYCAWLTHVIAGKSYCRKTDEDVPKPSAIPDACPLPSLDEKMRGAWNDLKAQLERDKEAGMGYKVSRALFLMEEMEEKDENH